MTSTSRQLGCGRDMDEVWAAMDRPPDEHEAYCPDCQAARASLAELAVATAELSALDTARLQAGPHVVDRILEIARSEVRRGRRLSLVRPGARAAAGELTVSEQAVAAVVRRVGDGLPGIQVRRCSVRAADDQARPAEPAEPAGPTGDEPAELSIMIRVSVGGDRPIVGLVDELRRAVIRVVAAEVGVVVGRVDVIVEDLHDA